ncbi:restriction endonuclease subunit S [Agathobacter rectalis]|nr:restriction endonuclease subunit S [Agathobacter rectalis]
MENPKIRFKGFTKDWEQRKLRECAEFNPKSELPDVFEYIDLESVVGTNILSHRTESKSSAPSRAQRLAQKGDVFYQTVRPYQKNNCIFEKNDNNWVFSTGYAQLRPVNDSYFLLTLLQNEDFVKLVLDRCTGTSYPAINSNDLADIDVNVPSDSKEQQQIGTYFKQLDHLITLHQRKCEQTKKLKKYMLQKMFPQNGAKVPEIRFDGFTYDWEQRKLGATNTFFTDGNYGEAYPKSSDMTDSGSGVPFLTGGNLKDGKLSLDGASYITPEKHSKLTSGHLLEDDIVIAVRGSLGALGYVNTDNSGWNINSQLAILRTDKSELYGKFLIQYLLSWTGQNELLKRQTGSALKQLPIGAIKDVEVPITSIAEQEKIGEYFDSVDHLITLHQRKCDELKKMKKYMLQNMFI